MGNSFDLPLWFPIYYDLIGTLSLLLNLFTIFLIVFKSNSIDNFRYYTLTFQVLCTFTDVHLSFLAQPIPIFPITGGYCAGVLAEFFGIWSHYLVTFLAALMVAQLEWLVFCFIVKHRIIGGILNRHVIPEKLFVIIEMFLPVSPVRVYLVIWMAGMRRKEQMGYVRENYSSLLVEFSTLPNVAIYTLNFWFSLIAGATIFGGVICGIIFVSTTLDMFNMLRDMQRKISTSNYKRHKAAVRSLVAQCAVTSFCLGLPLLIMIVVICEFRYAQLAVRALFAIFGTHSIFNALVLVVTTPVYRKFVLCSSRRRIQAQSQFMVTMNPNTKALM